MNTNNTKYRETFKRTERLKSRTIIKKLFADSSVIKQYPFRLVWMTEESETPFSQQIGVTASKRFFKRAVTRNFIKRRMRECIRKNKGILYSRFEDKNINLYYMIIYTGNEIIPFSEFENKINKLMLRLSDKVEKEFFT